MEVKPGYKMTEVGVIPEDWEVKTVDQVSFVTSGKRLPLGSSLTQHETDHPYIRVTDMRPGTVCLSEIKFVPEDVYPAIKRYRIFTDDIFISVAGSLGIVGKIPKQLDGANLTENADRITNISCSQDYLLYLLMSPLIQNAIESIQTVGAQPKLALAKIRKFEIPLPSTKAEQYKIAENLNNIELLLETLNRLLAKKRQIKQGAMRELLTGARRLLSSGEVGKQSSAYKVTEVGVIPKDWTVFDLGRYLRSTPAYGINAPAIPYNSRFPTYLRISDISEDGFFTEATKVSVAHSGANSYMLEDEDLVFARTGASVGKCYLYDRSDGELVFAGFLIRIQPDASSLDSAYLWYYTQTSSYRNWVRINSMRSGQPGINGREFSCLPIPLPPILSEQKAIVTILSEMDCEIVALETKLAKLRQIKQGMMQELLTGKTRLI